MKNTTKVILIGVSISTFLILLYVMTSSYPYVAVYTDLWQYECRYELQYDDFIDYPIFQNAINEEIEHPNIGSLHDISIFEARTYQNFLENQFSLMHHERIGTKTVCFDYVDKDGTSHRLAIAMGDSKNAVDSYG